MKHIATLAVMLIAQLAIAQTQLTYSRVIEVDSTNKDELYDRALVWFTKHTTGSNATLITHDREKGELSAKMSIPYSSAYNQYYQESKGLVWFNLSVQCKDNKYRYEFTSFTHEGTTNKRDISNLLFDEYIIHEQVSYGIITKDSLPPKFLIDKGGKKWAANVWAEVKSGCRASAIKIIEGLHSYMLTPVTIKKDDW